MQNLKISYKKIDDLGQKMFDFLAPFDQEAEQTCFVRAFNELNDKLTTLGIPETQVEIINDLFTKLNHRSFTRGFKAAYAFECLKECI